MSFREKSAWISFFSILTVFGYYFWNVGAQASAGQLDRRGLFGLLIFMIVVLAILEIVLHIVVAIQSPRDAMTPKDERERLIELKATRVAFYVFAVGALLAVASSHHGAGLFGVGTGVLLALVLAQLVSYGCQIFYYRRGF